MKKRRQPVNIQFHLSKTAEQFIVWLNEAGGAISFEELSKNFLKRFKYSLTHTEGFITNSQGLITGLEYEEVETKEA